MDAAPTRPPTFTPSATAAAPLTPVQVLALARKQCKTCLGTGFIIVQVQGRTKKGHTFPILNKVERRDASQVNPKSGKPLFLGSPRKDVTAELCGCVQRKLIRSGRLDDLTKLGLGLGGTNAVANTPGEATPANPPAIAAAPGAADAH